MQAPHRAITPQNGRERFLLEILDSLWARYRGRVEHARRYEELVERLGASFLNDHIAFRSFASQRPAAGVFSISRLFEALGYSAAGIYEFPDKHLGSLHLRHANPAFPKLFISELRTWELSASGRAIVARSLKTLRPPLGSESLAALRAGKPGAGLKKEVLRFFSELPWGLPQKRDVAALNRESQFGAWVLVNGYEVNHFTASVDAHACPALSDIEKTVAAMREAGIPMKAEIEGAPGSRLRQSSTKAVILEVPVKDGRRARRIPWTYAYFELAERPLRRDPETGRLERFEGFFGGQAAQLFEMTRLPAAARAAANQL